MSRESQDSASRETYMDDVLEVLADPARRIILYSLSEAESELTITELAHEVHQEFYNPGPQHTQSSYSSQYNSVDDVSRALEHNHLPLLNRYGLLNYNETEEIVEPKPLPQVTVEILEVLEDHETDQPLI